MIRTQTLKSILDPSGNHQIGVQLAFFTDDVPFAKLEIPSTPGGGISTETMCLLYTLIGKMLPPEWR